jgi:hypothetical protein
MVGWDAVSRLVRHLLCLDHVHELDPDERVLGCLKRLEPKHGTRDPLAGAMILFNNMIQIFYQRTSFRLHSSQDTRADTSSERHL